MRIAIAFGPSRSVGYHQAVRLSRRWFKPEELEPGRVLVVIELTGQARGRFVRLERLLALVGGWATTEVEVSGEPEFGWLVRQMSRCAADWMGAAGKCRERYPDGEPYSRCSVCPLARARDPIPDYPPTEWTL